VQFDICTTPVDGARSVAAVAGGIRAVVGLLAKIVEDCRQFRRLNVENWESALVSNHERF
jgi:hypothetical protein